jgi:hypothetical protein
MFAHCIRGWVERLYSSDRIFEEVLADYAEVADENGWELVNSETDLNTYRNRTPNPSVIVVIIIEPSEHSNHQTTYLGPVSVCRAIGWRLLAVIVLIREIGDKEIADKPIKI